MPWLDRVESKRCVRGKPPSSQAVKALRSQGLSVANAEAHYLGPVENGDGFGANATLTTRQRMIGTKLRAACGYYYAQKLIRRLGRVDGDCRRRRLPTKDKAQRVAKLISLLAKVSRVKSWFALGGLLRVRCLSLPR